MKPIFVIVALLLASCGSDKRLAPLPQAEEAAEYTPGDAADVDAASASLKAASSGYDALTLEAEKRAEEMKPLFLKLQSFFSFGTVIERPDVAPFVDDLGSISEIYTYPETAEAAVLRQKARDGAAALKQEADKSKGNDEAFKALQVAYDDQTRKIESGSYETARKWAGVFFGVSLIAFMASAVARWFMPGVGGGGKLAALGGLLMVYAGALLSISAALPFLQKFLDEYGAALLLLLLVPVILIYLKKRVSKNGDGDRLHPNG